MAPTAACQYLPPFDYLPNVPGLWCPMSAEDIFVNVRFLNDSTSNWRYIEFTQAGQQIGSILSRPDYESNIRDAALKLPKHGLTRIEFSAPSKLVEVIWQVDS